MSASILDAMFGAIYSDGAEVEAAGALNFTGGITATYNATTQRIDIDFSESDASLIDYDNSASGLTATNVQDAIDEIASSIGTPNLAAVLAQGTSTGANDISFASGRAAVWVSEVSLKRTTNVIFDTSGVDTRISAIGSDATVSFRQGTTRIGYASNVNGDATAPAFYLDAAFGAGTPRYSVSKRTSAAAGRDVIFQAGAAGTGSNQAGGTTRIRGGLKDGSGAGSNVSIEDETGVVYLATDVANTRVVCHRNTFRVGTSASAGNVTVGFENSSAAFANALWWDGGIFHVGDGTRRLHYNAADTGSGFGFEGHTFYVASTGVLEIKIDGIHFESGAFVNWSGGTAQLKRAGATFLSYDGTTLTLTGSLAVTTLKFGADPADTGDVGVSSGWTMYGEPSPAGTDGRLLQWDSSEQLTVGEDTNVAQVQIRALTEAALYAAGTRRGWATSAGWNVQTGAIGGHEVDIQEFTASGTWTKPAGAKYVIVQAVGSGGGGGGGARVTAGNACSGGSGGGAGILIERWLLASECGSAETVTINAAGTAGTGATVDNTAGGNGSAGGHAQFGSIIRACGGGGGAGGQLAAASGGGGSAGVSPTAGTGGSATGTSGGTAGSVGGVAGASGANGTGATVSGAGGSGAGGANGAAGGFGGFAHSGPAGGSAGGGISAGGGSFNGGAGASVLQSALGTGGGAAGVAPGGAGGNASTPVGPAGNAGGGGASNGAGAGGAGGTSTRGAGGAGGGSAISGNGGAGSAGGGGYLRVISILS